MKIKRFSEVRPGQYVWRVWRWREVIGVRHYPDWGETALQFTTEEDALIRDSGARVVVR